MLRQSIDKGEQRIRQIYKAIEELFEANICGKITDERFIKMTASYEKEQKNLTASVENWKLELKNAQQQKVNGRNRVKVDIYFTAVGMEIFRPKPRLKPLWRKSSAAASRQSPHKNSSGTVHKCETVPLLI